MEGTHNKTEQRIPLIVFGVSYRRIVTNTSDSQQNDGKTILHKRFMEYFFCFL